MIFITLNDGTVVTHHHGKEYKLTSVDIRNIVELQADGDELYSIIKGYENVPYPRYAVIVHWYGDMAKLIAAHLGKV